VRGRGTVPSAGSLCSVARLPWPVRSILAGTAGTATMTLAYALEHRLRPGVKEPLDYDDSLVPGEIVANIMHLPHVTGREEHELGLALRWSYGSAFGLWHGVLRRRTGEPWASAAFGATLMTDAHPVPPARSHAPAVAMAAERDRHLPLHPRRIRGRRRRGRRRAAVRPGRAQKSWHGRWRARHRTRAAARVRSPS